MIYLASPYTHGDPWIEEARVTATAVIASHFIEQGFPIFAPTLHGHFIEQESMTELKYSKWLEHGAQFLRIATELWVMDLPGWNKSSGIDFELHQWRVLGKETSVKMVDCLSILGGTELWEVLRDAKDC